MTSIMCQGLHGQTIWHLRGLMRLGVSRDDVKEVVKAVKEVGKWCGREDVEGWAGAEAVDERDLRLESANKARNRATYQLLICNLLSSNVCKGKVTSRQNHALESSCTSNVLSNDYSLARHLPTLQPSGVISKHKWHCGMDKGLYVGGNGFLAFLFPSFPLRAVKPWVANCDMLSFSSYVSHITSRPI